MTNSIELDQLAVVYLEAIRKIHHHQEQKRLNHATCGEAFVLHALLCPDEPMTPGAISEKLGMTTARVAAVLNALEKKGLLERSIDVQDRRRILVVLTEQGRVEAVKQFRQVKESIKQMLVYLGERDAKELIRILQRLAEREEMA